MRKTVEILPFQRFLWYNESMKNEMCNQLFSIEREIAGFPFEERCIQRQSRAKPVLDALLSWAERRKTPPKFALGRAVCYLKEQWPYLIRYLEDGRLEVSNNRAKRSIKPFVMDRKNFLFALLTPRMGHRAAQSLQASMSATDGSFCVWCRAMENLI